MKKVYVCYVERYDYFDSLCDHTYHKAGYEVLGFNPVDALKTYRNLKAHDYDYGDSYQKTDNIQVMWVDDPVTNKHNFFTPQRNRLHKFPVIGWDGTVIDHIVTSECELESPDGRQKLNQIGLYYNPIDKNIRSFVVGIEPCVSDGFDSFDDDDQLLF